MTLLQLQYFRAIAEVEHFTKAAEKLMVSQSSLSHSIKELEEELGISLFMRQGRNVKLTKYGEMFLPYVNQSLDVLGEGRACLENYINPNTGTIVLATQPSLSDFLSYITVRYLSETGRTNVNFKIIQSDTFASIANQLLENTVDFAFSTEVLHANIAQYKIGHHELVVLVSRDHPLAARDSVSLEELNEEKFIAYDHTCQLRTVTDHVFRELAVHPRIAFETAQDHLIYALVAANQGVTIVPRPLFSTHYNVKILTIENSEPKPRTIHLSWNKDSVSPATQRFRDFIYDHPMIFDEYMNALNENSSGN